MRLHSRQVAGRNGRRIVAVVVAASTLVISALMMPGASAAPKPTVGEVQRNIDQLQEQAEQASEQYNETKEQLASINVRLRAAKDKLTRQQTEVAKARVEVGRLAAETYRRGEMSTLDVLLGDDPDAMLAQAGYLPSLSERQNTATNRLKDGEAELVTTQATIVAQAKRAQGAANTMKLNARTVKQKLAAAKAQLARLEASQRTTLRTSQNRVASAGVPSGAGVSYCMEMAAKASNARAQAALRFACNQLGDPYQWAADGPGSWDCSGLTMKAWAAGGVSLPHSSKQQAGYGTRVSSSNLQPGDLVFFHDPISHVGIILGDGLMIHAPQTGDVVRIASLYATPTAAVRL